MANKLSSHRNLSIPSRNTLVINRIYKGATSAELEAEFQRKVPTLMSTLRSQHYSDTETGRKAYTALRNKLSENDKNAKTVSKTQSSVTISVPTNKAMVNTGLKKASPVTIKNVSKASPKTLYLVETGTLLNMPFEALLDLGSGKEVFYVPRFCIDELQKMSKNNEAAKNVLMNIYNDVVFKKRIFPLSNPTSEQSLLPKNPLTTSCKRRTLGIVDSALNLAMDNDTGKNIMVKVLTSSREVTDLMREVIRTENLDHILSFAFVSSRKHQQEA